MIEALAQLDVLQGITGFSIVLLRASGLVVFCPIFSSQILPRRFRVAIAFALATILLPLAPAAPDFPEEVIGWLFLAFRELAVGTVLGLAAKVVFDGTEGAARLVAGQSGFALATMLDPMTGSQSVTPALLQRLLATVLFLAADLHHLFIRGLVRSFELVPPGPTLPRFDALDQSVALLGGRIFLVSVQLAGPALVLTLAVDLVLILVGRAIPQVPVLIVGYPLKVAVGLAALLVLAHVTGSSIRWIGKTFASDGAAVIAALASS